MADPVDRHLLAQRWLHSREEDTEGEMVFRPDGYAFPPARGRAGFELRPDGSLVQLAPGPTDQHQETAGSWSLDEAAEPRLVLTEGSQSPRTRRILAFAPDRLVLEK